RVPPPVADHRTSVASAIGGPPSSTIAFSSLVEQNLSSPRLVQEDLVCAYVEPSEIKHRPRCQVRQRLKNIKIGKAEEYQNRKVVLDSKRMGRKDASAARIPVEQYRKQIGKQDYKKSRPVLRATRLKAEAKKTALGIKSHNLVTC
uniref:Triple QxxK/R motif-containing protein n=1 Tax=Gopherus evgoodei TaxID=1825980 RepID=A0A8C4VPS7_9SAUR